MPSAELLAAAAKLTEAQAELRSLFFSFVMKSSSMPSLGLIITARTAQVPFITIIVDDFL